MIFAFGSGGPVLLIYGFMFMALIASCIAVSLGELASAYPNSGTYLSPLPVPPGGERSALSREKLFLSGLIVARRTVLLG